MNMRSVSSGSPDDRTVRARVRDAAIDLIAAGGVEALTARAVAERAGVSPGSVIHNFGSMEGLRRAAALPCLPPAQVLSQATALLM